MDTIIRAARVAQQVHQLPRLTRGVPVAAPLAAAPDPDLDANAAAALQLERAAAEAAANILFEEARERGYADGLAAGSADGRAALDVQAARLRAIADSVAGAKVQALQDAEDAMVDLAFEALCTMLGEQAATRSAVAAMVRRHAAARAGREQVTLRLHPADVALLQDGAADAAADGPYRADPAVALGGCFVDSAAGTLDARLETQLERLRTTLLAVRAGRTPDAAP